MSGEMDLAVLLRSMEPVLDRVPYGYGVVPLGAVVPDGVFAVIAEAEGVTVVAVADVLSAAGIAFDGHWARISLTVHSSLAAVGLTAAIAAALAREGISANVVAGYFHDHVFVQWARRVDALAALMALTVAS
jgi:uncharacterized protein